MAANNAAVTKNRIPLDPVQKEPDRPKSMMQVDQHQHQDQDQDQETFCLVSRLQGPGPEV